ncbi:XRE family transcriptional regulator [Candidatus Microgenomates bacterium]|nr:MAG: XRE family transcriptional regulator [Candidatus Microgenomates bacterium]
MRKNAKLPRVLGSRVRRARKEAGLTQEDLAYKIGVSRVYMGFIEQGRNVPSLEILEKIARVLRTRLADFVR